MGHQSYVLLCSKMASFPPSEGSAKSPIAPSNFSPLCISLLVIQMWPLFLEAMEGYKWSSGDIIGYHLTLKGGPTLRYVCNTTSTTLILINIFQLLHFIYILPKF